MRKYDDEEVTFVKPKQKPVRFNEYKRYDPKRDKSRKGDYSANRQKKREQYD